MSFGDDTLDPSNFWDGKERRSGGPMAATVDRVEERLTNEERIARGWTPEIVVYKFEYSEIRAAIRRAAEKVSVALGMHPTFRPDCKWCVGRAEIVEKAVREELGL